MRKATIKGQTVIVDTAYCNTMAHSISVTDPQPILGRAVDILQEKQLQLLPVPFLGASLQYTTFTWEYFSTVLFCSCTHRGKRLKCHWFLLGVTHTQWQPLNRGSHLKETVVLTKSSTAMQLTGQGREHFSLSVQCKCSFWKFGTGLSLCVWWSLQFVFLQISITHQEEIIVNFQYGHLGYTHTLTLPPIFRKGLQLFTISEQIQ